MSPIGETWARSIGKARNLYSTALAVSGFFLAAGASLAFNLERSEGATLTIVPLWTFSVSVILPVLAAILGMESWSEERASGRLEILFTTAVRERDYTLGKFFGVWTILTVAVLAFLVTSYATLRVFCPSVVAGAGLVTFLPGVFALVLQGALWSALALAMSASFRKSATAAAFATILSVALPRAVHFALVNWASQGRLLFGEMPIDAHAIDLATGVFSSSTVIAYALATFVFLFVATKAIAMTRLPSRGGRAFRLPAVFAMALALVFAVLAILLASRLETVVDLNLGGGAKRLSPRTESILSSAEGEVVLTAFVSRGDSRFRTLAHFARSFARAGNACGGIRFLVRYVDPRWDIVSAERLVRKGVADGSLVLEKGRRFVAITGDERCSERAVASALLQLVQPPRHECVYWTVGHGEYRFDDYGAMGLSDIARELARDGYVNRALDLTTRTTIPEDAALVVIAGAKDDFSRVELNRFDAYLKRGGRVLALLSSEDGGLAPLLPEWGMRSAHDAVKPTRTLSGSDVVISDFAAHPIGAPLVGSQIVLERPVGFFPSAAVDGNGGIDSIEFSPLATADGQTLAAIVERGAGAGDDTVIRPTRIVAIGDALFVLNGSLALRANANRDFFLNAVAYLSGTDALTSGGQDSEALTLGMDRAERFAFARALVAVEPATVLVLLLAVCAWRRRRK